MTLTTAIFAEGSTNLDASPGLLGFLVVTFLGASLVLLYRSMRKQMRKVDFNDEGVTDEERMRRSEPTDRGSDGSAGS